MVAKYKKLVLLLALLCLLLCGCKQNPSETALYDKLLNHFRQRGHSCVLQPMPDEQQKMPIYFASVWKQLEVDGETVFVYFDESNRADYLLDGLDLQEYTWAGRFGLRFILLYDGADEAVLQTLKALPEN